MGKRILVAWELGGAEGHRLKLSWTAAALRHRGHEVVFALPRPDRAEGLSDASGRVQVLQSPPWPQTTGEPSRPRRPDSAASLFDGFGAAPGAMSGLIGDWENLFRTARADAIVADSAPICLTAARGRIPTVAVGTGFNLPPPDLARFPVLGTSNSPEPPGDDLLEAMNEEMTAAGRPPLRSLPELYRADRACVGTFTELDPYAAWRKEKVAAPWLPEWEGEALMRREELFGYFSLPSSRLPHILNGLGRAAFAGVPVSVYIPRIESETARLLATTRIRVEPAPLTLKEIQERARLIVSFGSLGLVSFALAAGIPQIVFPLSTTNKITGQDIETLQTGRSLRINKRNPIEPALIGQVIQQMYMDAELTARAIERAPGFIGRAFPRTAEVAAAMVDELL